MQSLRSRCGMSIKDSQTLHWTVNVAHERLWVVTVGSAISQAVPDLAADSALGTVALWLL